MVTAILIGFQNDYQCSQIRSNLVKRLLTIKDNEHSNGSTLPL
ncbi:hypothetical protein SAMN05216327_11814 [Dyadobacter sp. SG02]|nr:hypothetical protein SAMN05216327_11814 [Dyadobacter sp. SG02]